MRRARFLNDLSRSRHTLSDIYRTTFLYKTANSVSMLKTVDGTSIFNFIEEKESRTV